MIETFKWVAIATVGVAVCSLGIWLACKELVKRQPAAIRGTWYFYFLFAAITIVVALVSTSSGIIDATGQFHGASGELLNGALRYIFALNEHMAASFAIVLLVLVPQFGSYFFSGLFAGCAAAPHYSGLVFKFSLLILAKSLITAAGVLLGLGIFGASMNWEGLGARKATGVVVLSMFAILLAFYLISIRAEIDWMNQIDLKPGRLSRLHAWMTRNCQANP